MLLEHGADVNSVADPTTGMTLLGSAAKCGSGELVQLLLEHGADPALPEGNQNVQPSELASQGKHWKVELLIRTKIIKDRILNDPEFLKDPGNTLHSACHYSEEKIVQALLEAGVDIEAEHPIQGGKPLHWATEGNVKICNWLLERGADVNSKVVSENERNGMTPLIYCAWWCGDDAECIAIAENLIERGADTTARDAEGLSAVERAEKQGHTKLAEALRKMGCA